MEKITDKQVKKVEVIFDCSEFSSDTYMVKGYSATFYAERWDDNRRSGDISYTVILSDGLGVHIGVYQP